MADTPVPTCTLDELCTSVQQEMGRRHFPSPGGRVADGLNARTVRYYTTLGLIDRPLSYQGGSARYGPRHLLQLLAIKALQARFLPLPEVQKHLYGKSDAELLQIVESVPAQDDGPRLESVLSCQPVPGLRLLVEDREAFLDWVRAHPDPALTERLQQAIDLLKSPNHARRNVNGSADS